MSCNRRDGFKFLGRSSQSPPVAVKQLNIARRAEPPLEVRVVNKTYPNQISNQAPLDSHFAPRKRLGSRIAGGRRPLRVVRLVSRALSDVPTPRPRPRVASPERGKNKGRCPPRASPAWRGSLPPRPSSRAVGPPSARRSLPRRSASG